jgi:phosphoglycolate phosphatase
MSPRFPHTAVVLFDLDGVLVDSRAAFVGCVNHALAARGLPERAAHDLHRYIGPPLSGTFAELIAQAADSDAVAACVAAYRERYVDVSARETTVFDGIPEALDQLLAAGHRLAVATSKARVLADPLLEALGLRDRFDAVAGPEMSTLAEPKATTIAAALEALGRPDSAVMVGDRATDVAGARAHGLPAVGAAWGIGGQEELAAAGADVIVHTPAELHDTIATLATRTAATLGA